MLIKFDKEYLEQLYMSGKCADKKHRFQPSVIKGYLKCVALLAVAKSIEDLYPFHSLNYEVLKGDKVGISSVRINDQYRLEFMVTKGGDDELIINICTIIDITNHYK